MSYTALQNCMTIKELLLKSILKAYQIQVIQGDKKEPELTSRQAEIYKTQVGDDINLKEQEDEKGKKDLTKRANLELQ